MLLKTKFVNQLTKLMNPNDLDISIKNILVNHERRGCSGHITRISTGRCVYINTEPLTGQPDCLLYRLARDKKDFSSNGLGVEGRNRFTDENTLAEQVAKLLLSQPRGT